MIHLGDITKIDWSSVPPVDCVTGGSPCQDLSVAGKRAGLAGERSGLYMEQIRCVKELRKADERRGRTAQFIRPRYMVWENVPGAFSSNKGEDFRAVLEEAVRVVDPSADVPRPEKGKWSYSGAILGDGYSVAWRVHDAQFWGVPQRRRRISLVCDFGGQSAPEILFERKGLSGDSEPGRTPGEEAAGGTGKITESASRTAIPINTMVATKTAQETRTTFGVGEDGDAQFTISSTHSHAVCAGFSFGQSEKARSIGYQKEVSPTLRGGEGGNQKPCALCIGNGQTNQSVSDKAGALNTMHDQQAVMSQTVVRRLTPLEAERLQGYPDGWTDIGEWTDSNGKKHKPADSPRYKALGNSIALPFWFWLLRRISAQYYGPATLGSLFDGIGGFPLCWERCNGPGTSLWASEIEEFPMAVTKLRFPETT